jgi:hypothetical protein
MSVPLASTAFGALIFCVCPSTVHCGVSPKLSSVVSTARPQTSSSAARPQPMVSSSTSLACSVARAEKSSARMLVAHAASRSMALSEERGECVTSPVSGSDIVTRKRCRQTRLVRGRRGATLPNGGRAKMGSEMSSKSLLKTLLLAAAVSLLANAPGAFAKARSPGACLFHRHLVANGTVCVSHCDPGSLHCEQQSCQNGHWVSWLGCLRPFCMQPCG